MEAKIIREEVQKAFSASRKIKITIKKESIGEIVSLLGMEALGIIRIDRRDIPTFMAVQMSIYWGHDNNRVATITLADRFDEDQFVTRMEGAIEKIQAI